MALREEIRRSIRVMKVTHAAHSYFSSLLSRGQGPKRSSWKLHGFDWLFRHKQNSESFRRFDSTQMTNNGCVR